MWSFEVARQSDIAEILEIENVSFSHPWGELSFFEEMICKDARSYVLKNDSIIGYIFFRLIFGEMHIFKIAVSRRWRHQGIASMILGKSLNLAIQEGAESAFLEVRPSNVSALGLYRKFGFRVIAKRPGYYPETGEDGWILMKALGDI